ncbi:hypothetical protein PR202_ga10590 [Eleusine coracana subsp. coracana]|uniref:F-box domain-containing protein n=1 Tax=Eleusine coracana subsp. coracana TaxID=191504 RepID=A0AAV5C731_ELECO|nr:hypothetical protein QOZ80_1AG0023560 [Eleusine coracana subsp. coracana]GJM93983.1 hypothetical protein PR202_ga10590 [Eleusine coracana subsp. coracana]
MAGFRDPTQPPAEKNPKLSATPTTIAALGEDLLLDIFLRLPSLATLVRAALTCPAWRRAVASSSTFRRRFRELHPAPLLGIVAKPLRDALPAFTPAQRRDGDVLAAIRGGDFAFTSLLDPDGGACDAPLSWEIHDCRDGYLLLLNWDAKLLAVFNPLARRCTEYINMPFDTSTPAGEKERPVSLDVHLITSDEDPMEFNLVWLIYEKSRVQVTVFASNTGSWCFLPWVGVAERAPQHDADKHWLCSGMQVDGILYWPFKNREHMLKLDTETMEFSVSELPPYLKGQQDCKFFIGETKGREPCIVYCTGLNICVLKRKTDDGGVERWVLDGTVHYEKKLRLVAIWDGFVYYVTSEMVLLLCLETMKIENLFPRSFRAHHLYPYIMAWPPSLVGNFRSFAVIQDNARNQ